MLDFFQKLFTSDFMPHGHCYLWRPELVWLHTSSDSLIALAYFLIPLSLFQIVRKRRDLTFNWMILMFVVFILACGCTHLMEVWNVWHAEYRLAGLIKAITALASLITAILMFQLVPGLVAIPSTDQLRRENEERKKAEAEVRTLNHDLEFRVAERTAMLQRSNDALQRFAYIASHDLQEPVRTVRTLNQLLARDYAGKIDGKADMYISHVVEASGRMHELVINLLDYARITPELPAVNEVTDSGLVLQEALDDFRTLIQECSAEVEYANLPKVAVNPVHLRKLFENLLSNSIKYRNTNCEVWIKVEAEMRGPECLFSFADNGIGFDQQYSEQIFVAFSRLHGKEYPGSGVGLSVCKTVVEKYGGRIWAKSNPLSGTVICFTLPLAREANLLERLRAGSNAG